MGGGSDPKPWMRWATAEEEEEEEEEEEKEEGVDWVTS